MAQIMSKSIENSASFDRKLNALAQSCRRQAPCRWWGISLLSGANDYVTKEYDRPKVLTHECCTYVLLNLGF